MSSFHAPYLSFFNVNYLDTDFYLQAFLSAFYYSSFVNWWAFFQQIKPKGIKENNQLQESYLDKTASDQVPCCFEPHIITYSCAQQGSDTVISQSLAHV